MTKEELINKLNEILPDDDTDVWFSIQGSKKYPCLRFTIEDIDCFYDVIDRKEPLDDKPLDRFVVVLANSNEDFEEDE